MQSCLKICGDCASAKNRPGCRRTGTRKSRAPSGVPRVMLGVQTSMKPRPSIVRADRRDHGRARAACSAACASRAQVEPAVAQAQGLVDVLLVELERQRRRARDDLELVHLQLDRARRHRGVDGLGRPRDDLAARAEHELVADLLRELGGVRRPLGVDDELRDARVVAQVDEDEPAVVPARVHPARERQRLPDVLGPRLAAHDVAPGHGDSLSRSASWETALVRAPGSTEGRGSPRRPRRPSPRRFGPPASAGP